MCGNGCGGWGWIAGGLMMLIFWGGLAALVVFLVRGLGARRSQGGERPSEPDAWAILAERFARGEISGDEFEQRRRALKEERTALTVTPRRRERE